MATPCTIAVQRFVEAKASYDKARRVYASYLDSCASAQSLGLLADPDTYNHLEELTQRLRESIDRLELEFEQAAKGLLEFLSSLPAESLSVLVASSDDVTTRFTLNTPQKET